MFSQTQIRLPRPEPEWLTTSNELRAKIITQIKHSGWIGFDQYMQLALYHERLGYYRNGLPIFGTEGDFITAPQLGSLFGKCLARQCEQVLQTLQQGSILEFGGGDGILAATILEQLDAQDKLPEQYLIIETGAELQRRQRRMIAQRCPQALSRVQWLERLPTPPFDGVIIANEVLDAMPVQRFIINQAATPCILGVGVQALKPSWYVTSQHVAAAERLTRYNLSSGYQGEIGLQAEAWTRSIAELLGRGLVLLIDYGFPRHEMYHIDRHGGTLMCHYRQYAHTDPFYYPGLQDITAHVDFTAIAEAGLAAGVELAGYTSQAAFLLALDILESVNHCTSIKQQQMLTQQIKKLTLPHEMGELFKVIGFSRDLELELTGFKQMDRRNKLWT